MQPDYFAILLKLIPYPYEFLRGLVILRSPRKLEPRAEKGMEKEGRKEQ
ncbi:MAG: hypothetical protein NVSMB14_13900 [Isosphaeraceae bacterium]